MDGGRYLWPRLLATLALLIPFQACTSPQPDAKAAGADSGQPPAWWAASASERDGRFWCVGQGGKARSADEGLARAEQDAMAQIARVVSVSIVAQTREEVSRETAAAGKRASELFAAAARSLADESLKGVRREDSHVQAAQEGVEVRVLMSVPLSEIRPSPERRREQLADLATSRMKRGDPADAARCWQTLGLMDPSVAIYAMKAAECLESVGLWQDALEALERFRTRYPGDAQVGKMDTDIQRLKDRIAGELGAVQWAETLGRIRQMAQQHSGGQLTLATDRRIYPMLNPAGEPHEIILTVHTARKAYLNLVWIDAEGVFMMDDYATADVPVRRWDDKLMLRAGTVSGDVTLLAVASPERLPIAARQVLVADVDRRDPAALTRLSAFEKALRAAAVGEGCPMALVDFTIMPSSR